MPVAKPVLRSDDAERDLIRLWLHLAEYNPETADRYIRRIQIALERIADFPDNTTPRPDLGEYAYKLVVDDYVVFYDHLPDSVIVLRVFHHKEVVEPFFRQYDE